MKQGSRGASPGPRQVRARHARKAAQAAAAAKLTLLPVPALATATTEEPAAVSSEVIVPAAVAASAAVARSGLTRNGIRYALLGAGICAVMAAHAFWSAPQNNEYVESGFFESSPVVSGNIDQLLLSPAALPGVGQMLSTARSPDATAGYGLGFDAGLLPAVASGWRAPRIDAAGAPHEQKWVTAWLARKYRVAGDAANMLVSATYSTAKDLKFDPLLILAVMAIESGLNPIAESPMGAQGLMQVMSKVHHEKFRPLGGVEAALNPVANIKVGSMILKDYVKRGGSVEAGLKMYVGAAAFESDAGYGNKVLSEYRRLQEVARGKSVAMNAVMRNPNATRASAAVADNSATPASTTPATNATNGMNGTNATNATNPASKPKLVDGSNDTPKTAEPVQRKVDVLASA